MICSEPDRVRESSPSAKRSKFFTTVSGVSGDPSENVTSSLIVKVNSVASSLPSGRSVASHGCSSRVSGSW